MNTPALEEALKAFPGVFRLKAFPGQRFRVNASASYGGAPFGPVMLYVYTEEGVSFCKGSPEELRREVVA